MPEPRYRIDSLSTLPEIESVLDEWATLAALVGARPMMSGIVAMAWLRHLNKGEPLVITARDEAGALVGVVPLHERMLGPVRVTRWIGHGLGTIGEFVTAPGQERAGDAMIECLAANPWRVLELVECREDGGGIEALRRAPGLRLASTPHDVVPVIDLEGIDSVDELLALPDKKNLRRNVAKLDRPGRAGTDRPDEPLDPADELVRVRVATTSDEVRAVIPAISAIHDVAEQGNPRLHLLREPYKPFTVEALMESAARGQAAVIILEKDRPVGFMILFVSGRRGFAWLSRHDPSLRPLSPGHRLLRGAVEWAVASGLTTLDLGVGGDDYKQRWATRTTSTSAVTAARKGLLLPAQGVVRAVNWRSRMRAE